MRQEAWVHTRARARTHTHTHTHHSVPTPTSGAPSPWSGSGVARTFSPAADIAATSSGVSSWPHSGHQGLSPSVSSSTDASHAGHVESGIAAELLWLEMSGMSVSSLRLCERYVAGHELARTRAGQWSLECARAAAHVVSRLPFVASRTHSQSSKVMLCAAQLKTSPGPHSTHTTHRSDRR